MERSEKDAIERLRELAEHEGDRELVRVCEAARRGDERALAMVEETWLVRIKLGNDVSHPVRAVRTG